MHPWAAKLTPYRLPFTHPWSSHKGVWQERHGWLLQISDRQGYRGHGDIAPLPQMGSEPPAQSEAWLDATLATLQHLEPRQALQQLPAAPGHPAARCGLECALLDLLAQRQQRPLWQLLGGVRPAPLRTNATIGNLDSRVTERALDAVAAGFDTLKLKIGVQSAATELARLQQLADRLPPGIHLRLDANQAWDPAQAQRLVAALNRLPVESLEEPLAEPLVAALKGLQQAASFDLALDESLAGFLTRHPLSATPVRRLVIKPMLLGGLLPSLRLIRQAAAYSLRCIVTSSLESSAGIWPLCHLAAVADQQAGPATHGLATSHLFSRDLGLPPTVEQASIALGSRPGSGFILQEDTS